MKYFLYSLITLVVSFCAAYSGFLIGEKRYEVNLYVPSQVKATSLEQAKKGFDACVKLIGYPLKPICNCEVLDRGQEK